MFVGSRDSCPRVNETASPTHPTRPPRYTYCCSCSTWCWEVFIGWRNTCPRVNETASPTHPPDLPFTPTVAHVRHGIGNYTVRQSHLACPNGKLRGHEVPWGAPGGPQALEPARTRTKTHMAVLTMIWDVAGLTVMHQGADEAH